MSKKVLIASVVILIVLTLLFAVWFFLFREGAGNVISIAPTERGRGFFPVGSAPEDPTRTLFGDQESGEQRVEFIPALRKLSGSPTSGAISFERQSTTTDSFVEGAGAETPLQETETVFRYIERSTGHLFEATERTLTQERISNITIPKAHDAIFSNDGSSVLLRLVGLDGDTIETFSANLEIVQATTTSGLPENQTQLIGEYLVDNILEVSAFGNGFSYLVRNDEGGGNLVNSVFGSNSSSVLNSFPLTEFILQRPNSSLIALTTKPDSTEPGTLFFYNQNSGNLERILENVNGLTTLTSPDGENVLYSLSRGVNTDTFIYNIPNDETTRLAVNTVADKCAWSNNDPGVVFCGVPASPERAPMPETWYQGLVSFNDFIWKIDVVEERYDQVLTAQGETDEIFDIIKPHISPNDEYFVFINKNDLSLWSLDLIQN